MSGKRMLRANGVELCVETFGSDADQPVLLIGGASASMDWWDEEFCERIAAGPRFVIRYDHRDTGESVSYEAGAPAYTGPDLAADALGVLDALGVTAAHVVGISMGGAMAQLLAVERPERLITLTLMSTSPAGPGDPDRPPLPPMSDEIRAAFAEPPPAPDWTDRTAVVDYLVATQRPYVGSYPFDEERLRGLAGRIFDRTRDMAAATTNHWIIDGGDPGRVRLDRVTAPTLVLHGTEDPLFPYGHAEALAREIPGARLIPLERVGHEMPPPQVWEVVVPAILRHTADRRS